MQLEVIASDGSPWYAQGLSFTCTQCGNCCTGGPGFVWISEEEIDRLAGHLNISRPETLKKYCRKIGGRISLKELRTPEGNFDCIFLKETKIPGRGQRLPQVRRTCTIYSVRPLQCRTWPFWDGLMESPENWELAAKRCPGMNTGRKYTLQQMEALRDAKDWPDAPPSSS